MIKTSDSIQLGVLGFLKKEILFDTDHQDIGVSDPLFDGLLDSVGTLRLVVFLEETYSIRVADGELDPDNFGSVERIVSYVRMKTS